MTGNKEMMLTCCHIAVNALWCLLLKQAAKCGAHFLEALEFHVKCNEGDPTLDCCESCELLEL